MTQLAWMALGMLMGSPAAAPVDANRVCAAIERAWSEGPAPVSKGKPTIYVSFRDPVKNEWREIQGDLSRKCTSPKYELVALQADEAPADAAPGLGLDFSVHSPEHWSYTLGEKARAGHPRAETNLPFDNDLWWHQGRWMDANAFAFCQTIEPELRKAIEAAKGADAAPPRVEVWAGSWWAMPLTERISAEGVEQFDEEVSVFENGSLDWRASIRECLGEREGLRRAWAPPSERRQAAGTIVWVDWSQHQIDGWSTVRIETRRAGELVGAPVERSMINTLGLSKPSAMRAATQFCFGSIAADAIREVRDGKPLIRILLQGYVYARPDAPVCPLRAAVPDESGWSEVDSLFSSAIKVKGGQVLRSTGLSHLQAVALQVEPSDRQVVLQIPLGVNPHQTAEMTLMMSGEAVSLAVSRSELPSTGLVQLDVE